MKANNLYQVHIPKHVVARWCYPGVKVKTASRQLRRDIMRFPEVLHKLEALGYRARQRHFSFAQAQVLNEHYCGDGEQVSATELLWRMYGDASNDSLNNILSTN